MRKLVLGILAVFCVQLAFVIYTALQSPLEVAVGPIYSDTQTEPPVSGPAQTGDTDPSSGEREYIDSPAEPKAVDERRSNLVPSPQHSVRPSRLSSLEIERPRVQTPAKQAPRYFTEDPEPAVGDFETVVITYDRSQSLPDCEIKDTPRPKKRSYLAKAAPVIKKPWEWIKAVGSKFN